MTDAHPTVPEYQSGLAASHNTVGRFLAKEGRFAEAFAALDAGLALHEKLVAADTKSNRSTTSLGYSHAYRGWARARAGQPKEVAANLRTSLELWAKAAAADAEERFETARTLALLVKLGADPKSGVTADEAKNYVDRAVEALSDAVKAGWAQPVKLREPDFDAVRDRADFRKLVKELEAKAAAAERVAPPPRPATR